jgi:hypothetical protein
VLHRQKRHDTHSLPASVVLIPAAVALHTARHAARQTDHGLNGHGIAPLACLRAVLRAKGALAAVPERDAGHLEAVEVHRVAAHQCVQLKGRELSREPFEVERCARLCIELFACSGGKLLIGVGSRSRAM